MKRIQVVLSVGCVLLLTLSFALPLAAQDVTVTQEGTDDTTLTQCDSSLILLAGLAQRFFGFDPSPDVDLNIFEVGQFAPLFDMSTVISDSDGAESSTEGSDASAKTTEETADDSAAQTTDTSESDAGPSISLNPPFITDEDISCIQLRTSLENFFSNEFLTPDWDQRFRSEMTLK